MSRNSGTRSGLLWEVERLLKETEKLPQVLLMENVPQVCGGQNIRDFEEWLKFLENLGYANFYKVLNAKDFGVPQNRERCYMISILGNYWYDFPKLRNSASVSNCLLLFSISTYPLFIKYQIRNVQVSFCRAAASI